MEATWGEELTENSKVGLKRYDLEFSKLHRQNLQPFRWWRAGRVLAVGTRVGARGAGRPPGPTPARRGGPHPPTCCEACGGDLSGAEVTGEIRRQRALVAGRHHLNWPPSVESGTLLVGHDLASGPARACFSS